MEVSEEQFLHLQWHTRGKLWHLVHSRTGEHRPLPREVQRSPVLTFNTAGQGVVECGAARGWACNLMKYRLVIVDGQYMLWDGAETIRACDASCELTESYYLLDLVGSQGGEVQQYIFKRRQVDMMYVWWSLPALVIMLGLAKLSPPSRFIHKRWAYWERWWGSMQLPLLYFRRSLTTAASDSTEAAQQEPTLKHERALRCYSLSTFAVLATAAKLAFSPMCHAADDNKVAWRSLLQGLTRAVVSKAGFVLLVVLDPELAGSPAGRFALALHVGDCMIDLGPLRARAAALGHVDLAEGLRSLDSPCECCVFLGTLMHHKELWPIAVDAMRTLAWELERTIRTQFLAWKAKLRPLSDLLIWFPLSNDLQAPGSGAGIPVYKYPVIGDLH